MSGFDVWCAEDAPEFKTWRRVAWLLFKPDTFTISEIDTCTFDDDTRRWPTDNDKLHCIDIIEAIAGVRWKNDESRSSNVIRSYRVLPAGSPAPKE